MPRATLPERTTEAPAPIPAEDSTSKPRTPDPALERTLHEVQQLSRSLEGALRGVLSAEEPGRPIDLPSLRSYRETVPSNVHYTDPDLFGRAPRDVLHRFGAPTRAVTLKNGMVQWLYEDTQALGPLAVQFVDGYVVEVVSHEG